MTSMRDILFSIKRVIGILLLMSAANLAFAVPMPPLLLCGGQACNASGYDLSSYDIPFAYSWPTAPTITHDAVVSNASQLNSANVNGARITLQAGSYGDVQTRDDQEWILQAGAEIDVLTYDGSQRVIVRGETPRAGRIGTIRGSWRNIATDIMFDGVYQLNGSWTTEYLTWNVFEGRRIAVVNSSLNTTGYVVFASSEVTDGVSNLIVAGNYLRSHDALPGAPNPGHSLSRIMSANKVIFAGNYFQHTTTPAGGGLGVRFHVNDPAGTSGQDLSTHDIYFGNNIVIGGTQSSGVTMFSTASNVYLPAPFYDVVIENNELYNNDNGGGVFRYDGGAVDGSAPTNVILRNNIGYGGGAGFPASNSAPDYDISSWTVFGNVANRPTPSSFPTPQSKLGFTP